MNTQSFKDILSVYKSGTPVVLADDVDRENEGDITVASDCINEELITFMMREARGLICVSITEDRARDLNLSYQTSMNASSFQTPFTVSVDHNSVKNKGQTAAGKVKTIKSIIDPMQTINDFTSPGFTFPLIAHKAGVLGRRGQTEGSFDLSRLSGLTPSGVICEILADDGSMMRGQALIAYAQKYKFPYLTVADIALYRLYSDIRLRTSESYAHTGRFGTCQVEEFVDDRDGSVHFAFIFGDPANSKNPLVRIHSECLTGDVFTSLRCDCGGQLEKSAEVINKEGAGIILYLRQEGRGIGLLNKVKAYNLQDTGSDTVEANVQLGFKADERDFLVAVCILEKLGIGNIRLLTNNPDKLSIFDKSGITITERVPLVVKASFEATQYLTVKKTKLGHLL